MWVRIPPGTPVHKKPDVDLVHERESLTCRLAAECPRVPEIDLASLSVRARSGHGISSEVRT